MMFITDLKMAFIPKKELDHVKSFDSPTESIYLKNKYFGESTKQGVETIDVETILCCLKQSDNYEEFLASLVLECDGIPMPDAEFYITLSSALFFIEPLPLRELYDFISNPRNSEYIDTDLWDEYKAEEYIFLQVSRGRKEDDYLTLTEDGQVQISFYQYINNLKEVYNDIPSDDHYFYAAKGDTVAVYDDARQSMLESWSSGIANEADKKLILDFAGSIVTSSNPDVQRLVDSKLRVHFEKVKAFDVQKSVQVVGFIWRYS